MDNSYSESLNFNQSSLQDYLDCPRRFELGFLRKTSWPAPHSTPLSKLEDLAELGTKFHQICQQYFIGIDPDTITASISDQELIDLWESFLPYGRELLTYPSFPEQTLIVPIKKHYLVAKFDLIIQVSPDEFLIIDWKTSRKKPSRTILSNRMQTYLYPFILHKTGADLFPETSLLADSIKLQYWFPRSNDHDELFPYSQSKHDEVSKLVSNLISEIDAKIESSQLFELTDDLDKCKYCVFRSFCERGYRTNPIPEAIDLENEDLSSTLFDMNLINEIEF
jgi:hypothetical protein